MKKLLYSFLVLMCAQLFTVQGYAQGTNMEFGQNTIKYKDFNWLYVHTEHFNTFYYGDDRELAEYTLKRAEAVLKEVEHDLGYRLSGRMHIILYSSLTDYKQSGAESIDPQFQAAGYTELIDNKIPIWFDGDYVSLQQQIKKGIAAVLLNEMMYGGSLQERIQNSTLMNLPYWFTEGLVSYLANEWSVEMDDRMKDALETKKFDRFNYLTKEEQKLAGQSIWKFLVETEGRPTIANILYVTRLTRNYENGFIFVLGDNFGGVYDLWKLYYKKVYSEDEDNRYMPEKAEELPAKFNDMVFTQMKINKLGNRLALVTNDEGLRTVYVHKVAQNSIEPVFKLGYKSYKEVYKNDYPLVAWAPDNRNLAIIYAKKGVNTLRILNTRTNKVEEYTLKGIDQVTSFNYSVSGDKLVLAAINRGQTDIYIYKLTNSKLIQVTNDIYTEGLPVFADNDESILYSSNSGINQTGDEFILSPTTDIFKYNFKQDSVYRLTNTATINEVNPIDYTVSYYSFLADNNGIYNSYVVAKQMSDSVSNTIYPLTNYKRSIIRQSVSPDNNSVAELIYNEGSYKVYVSYLSDDITEFADEIILKPTAYKKTLTDSSFLKRVILEKIEKEEEGKDTRKSREEKEEIDTDDEEHQIIKVRKPKQDTGIAKNDSGYVFQTPYPDDYNEPEEAEEEAKTAKIIDVNKRQYKLEFSPSYFVAQLDISTLNTYYIPTGADRSLFNSSRLAGVNKIGITDLMGNYRLDLGVKVIGFLTGTDYWMTYTDTKHRLEKTASFYRKARFQDESTRFRRITIAEGSMGVRYPFSDRASIKADVFMREDNIITLSSDKTTISVPDNRSKWIGFRSKYVFDNTISRGINLYNGFKFALYAESFNPMLGNHSSMLNVGADFRYYQKVKRQIIWANRFSINTSTGGTKVNYFVGGVENWISPRFNNELASAVGQDYAYQAIISGVRGFRQNVRNGNSAAVLNSELRIPIIDYLATKPIASDFLKNFMVTQFVDIGTAWIGPSPYSVDNPFNVRNINRSNLDIKIISQGNPYVGGFGFGLRTRVLGYYLKFDKAWGVEQGKIAESHSYFSLGLDF